MEITGERHYSFCVISPIRRGMSLIRVSIIITEGMNGHSQEVSVSLNNKDQHFPIIIQVHMYLDRTLAVPLLHRLLLFEYEGLHGKLACLQSN